jgi:tellurite resistance protein TerC
VYLHYGLAVILGFIGIKLLIHALHENELPFINGGEHVTAIPEVPTWLSLVVIVVTLFVTTVTSLARSRRDAREAVAAGGAGAGGPADGSVSPSAGRDAAAVAGETGVPTAGRQTDGPSRPAPPA